MPVIFEDGFESGDFSKWFSRGSYGNGLGSIVIEHPHTGIFNARAIVPPNEPGIPAWGGFFANHSTEGVGLNYVKASAFYYISKGLPLPADGSYFYLLQAMSKAKDAQADETIMIVGARKVGAADQWRLLVRNGAEWWGADGGIILVQPQWILVEAELKIDPVTGFARLLVNGQLQAEILNVNTTNFSLDRIRFGAEHSPSELLDLEVDFDDCVIESDVLPSPECSIVEDCVAKYGPAPQGYKWLCDNGTCVQARKTGVACMLPPQCTAIKCLHVLREKVFTKKQHKRLHPLI